MYTNAYAWQFFGYTKNLVSVRYVTYANCRALPNLLQVENVNELNELYQLVKMLSLF